MRKIPAAWHEQVEREIDAAFEAGRLAGLAEYDREIVAALARAFGGTTCPDRGEAIRRHWKGQDRQARRDAFDRGDPKVLAEATAWAEKEVARQRDRAKVQLREAANIPAIGGGNPGEVEYYRGWWQMRPLLGDRVWEGIWADFSPETKRRLAQLDPARPKRPALRVVA